MALVLLDSAAGRASELQQPQKVPSWESFCSTFQLEFCCSAYTFPQFAVSVVTTFYRPWRPLEMDESVAHDYRARLNGLATEV